MVNDVIVQASFSVHTSFAVGLSADASVILSLCKATRKQFTMCLNLWFRKTKLRLQ